MQGLRGLVGQSPLLRNHYGDLMGIVQDLRIFFLFVLSLFTFLSI